MAPVFLVSLIVDSSFQPIFISLYRLTNSSWKFIWDHPLYESQDKFVEFGGWNQSNLRLIKRVWNICYPDISFSVATWLKLACQNTDYTLGISRFKNEILFNTSFGAIYPLPCDQCQPWVLCRLVENWEPYKAISPCDRLGLSESVIVVVLLSTGF